MNFRSIADWMANYAGPYYGNNAIDRFVKENGGTGILLSDGDIAEIFGDNYAFTDNPSALYLKPFGATIYEDGKQRLLNVQMVTNVPGGVGKPGDMHAYALIVEGQVYAMKNDSGQFVGSSNVAQNGPPFLNLTDYNNKPQNNMYNITYSSIDTFIAEITKGGKRTFPFQLIN